MEEFIDGHYVLFNDYKDALSSLQAKHDRLKRAAKAVVDNQQTGNIIALEQALADEVTDEQALGYNGGDK